MSFIQDNILTVTIDSSKGIDGSTAITRIPQGNCYNLENADLSTAGKISRRKGYQTWAGDFPIKTINCKGNIFYFDAQYLCPIKLYFYKYKPSGVSTILDPISPPVVRDLDEYLIVTWDSTDPNYLTFLPDQDTMVGFGSVDPDTIGVSLFRQKILPRALYGQTMIWSRGDYEKLLTCYPSLPAWAGLADGTSLDDPGFIGFYRGYHYNRIQESSIVSAVRNVNTITLTTNVPVELEYNSTVRMPLYNLSGRCTAANATRTVFTIVFDPFPIWALAQPALNFLEFLYVTSTDTNLLYADSTSTTPQLQYFGPVGIVMNQDAGFTSPAFSWGNLGGVGYFYGLGINAGGVSAIESITRVGGTDKILWAQTGGKSFIADPNNARVKTVRSPGTVGTTQILTKTLAGTFVLNVGANVANYALNDIVYHIEIEDTKGTEKTLSFKVTGIDLGLQTLTLLPDDKTYNTVKFYSNEVVHYTRTSNAIPLGLKRYTPSGEAYPAYTGCVVQFSASFNPLQPSYRVRHVQNVLGIGFDDEILWLDDVVTYNSYDDVYAMSPWFPTPVSSQALSEYNPGEDLPLVNDWLQDEIGPTDLVPLASQAFSSSAVSTSKDSGMYRYDGVLCGSLHLHQPQVLSIRSVLGSKGLLPTRTDAVHGIVGLEIQLICTFSYIDDYGRTVESYPTERDAIKFTPNASVDGTPYCELVELAVAPMQADSATPVSKMWLNIYRTVTEQTTQTQLQFVLEKRIPMGEANAPIIAIIGDKGVSDAASRITLDALVTGSSVPAPRAKILGILQNRMFAMNIATLPFIRISGTRVFDNDGKFNSWLKLTARKNYIARDKFLDGVTPLIDDSAVRFITVPWGVKGTISNNAPQIYCDNSNYPASETPFESLPLDWLGGYVTGLGKADYTFTYQDASNIFTATYSGAKISNNVKFRNLEKEYKEIYSIRFNTDVFRMENTASLNVTSPTKWLESVGAGAPKLFAFFEKLAEYTNNTDAYVQAGLGADLGIYLYVSTAVDAVGIFENMYLVLQGLGTTSQVKELGGSAILSWESDITVATGTKTAIGTTYFRYTLTPVKLRGGSSAVSDPVQEDPGYSAAPTSNVRSTQSIAIFGFLKAGVANRVASLSGFTQPSGKVIIGSPGIGAYYAAGEYVSVFWTKPINSAFPSNFPDLSRSYEVTASNTNTIEIDTLNTYEVYRGTLATSVTISGSGALFGSRIINLNRLVFMSGGELWISVYVPIHIPKVIFMMVRGADPSSCALQLCGWFPVIGSWSQGGGSGLRLAVPAGFEIDYSRISGVNFSAIILAQSQETTPPYDPIHYPPRDRFVPVPVPLNSESTPNYADIARPFFTSDFISPESMLTQVTKRFAMAVNLYIDRDRGITAGYGLYGDVSYLNIPAEENAAVLVDTIPIAGSHSVAPAVERTYYEVVAGKPGAYTVYGEVNGVVQTQDVSAYPSTNIVYPAILDLPNFIQWTTTVAANVQDAAVFPMFKRGFTFDLGSQDDAEITAACAFRDLLLVFKRNSVWRVGVDNTGAITAQRLQASVGTLAMKNVVAYDDGVYFLHESGMHVTDGNTVLSVFALSRSFEKFVTRNPSLLARCAGYADTEAKLASVGVPYNSEFSTQVESVDGQFVFSYNDNVLGWSINNHIDAMAFAREDNQTFFGSTRGRVYRMRTEVGLTKYRDGSDPIPFMLQTRYLPALGQQDTSGGVIESSDQLTKFKFLRNVLFQFGADTDYDTQVYYSLDYKETRVPLELYKIRGAQIVTGIKTLGNDRFVKAFRDTLGVRAAQISFTLFDNSLDSDSAIYSISVEGWVTNTRLVPQQATRSNGR